LYFPGNSALGPVVSLKSFQAVPAKAECVLAKYGGGLELSMSGKGNPSNVVFYRVGVSGEGDELQKQGYEGGKKREMSPSQATKISKKKF